METVISKEMMIEELRKIRFDIEAIGASESRKPALPPELKFYFDSMQASLNDYCKTIDNLIDAFKAGELGGDKFGVQEGILNACKKMVKLCKDRAGLHEKARKYAKLHEH